MIPPCYNPTETPLYRGRFADVWKGQHDGREVAAKVQRVCLKNDLKQIRQVGFSLLIVCIDELTVSCAEILQGGHNLERPPSSKRAAAVGRDDD